MYKVLTPTKKYVIVPAGSVVFNHANCSNEDDHGLRTKYSHTTKTKLLCIDYGKKMVSHTDEITYSRLCFPLTGAKGDTLYNVFDSNSRFFWVPTELLIPVNTDKDIIPGTKKEENE